MKSFKHYITEEPQLDTSIESDSSEYRKFDSAYLKSKESAFILDDGHKFLGHRNLGEIHPGYELHQHVTSVTGDDGKPEHHHQYSIVHKKSKEVAGAIDAAAGKIDPKTGEFTSGTEKGLKVKWVGIHNSWHSSKKVGTSLPIAAYKHLHKLGYSIKSDSTQSRGGAILWNRLRNDPEIKRYVKFHDERDNRAVPAYNLNYGDIWKKNASGKKITLVLHAKPKKIKSR